MIDKFRQVNRLLVKLEQNLPLIASLTPQASDDAGEGPAAATSTQRYQVTAVHYLGEEGGIICQLDQGSSGKPPLIASLTQLSFDRKQPCAKEIAAYQKARAEREGRSAVNASAA